VFPEFGYRILRQASVEEGGKGRDTVRAEMFNHFIAYACGATSLTIR
jgi:hypothetical protein